jgi:ribosomal protein L21E
MNASFGGLLLAGATFALCGVAAPTPAWADSPPPRSDTQIKVQNDRPVPVDVYVQDDYFDTKVGTVAPDRVTSLDVPKYLEGHHVQIFVRPAIGLELETPEVVLPTRGHLDILVPDNDVGYVVQRETDEVMPSPGANTTTLTVSNPRDDAVRVVVERGEFDTTIGTVAPDHIRTFDLPASLTREPQDVRVFVVPNDGFELGSQYFMLRPHAHLVVRVPLD